MNDHVVTVLTRIWYVCMCLSSNVWRPSCCWTLPLHWPICCDHSLAYSTVTAFCYQSMKKLLNSQI